MPENTTYHQKPRKPQGEDLTYQRFNRLLAIERSGTTKWKNAIWYCLCNCGKTVHVPASSLKQGGAQSCGCLNRELSSERRKKHGLSRTPIHNAWVGIIARCTDPSNDAYIHYGGRGISVAPEWLGENGFVNFYNHLGDRPGPQYSIDRKDNNGNYEPGNVRWATKKEQMRNTRSNRLITYMNETKTLTEWAELKELSVSTLWNRIQRWDIERALTTPPIRS